MSARSVLVGARALWESDEALSLVDAIYAGDDSDADEAVKLFASVVTPAVLMHTPRDRAWLERFEAAVSDPQTIWDALTIAIGVS